MSVTLDAVMAALRSVPGAAQVRDLKIEGQSVALKLVLTDAQWLLRAKLEMEVKEVLIRLAGATQVSVVLESADAAKGRKPSADKNGVLGVKHIIAVSSGKGGVGKSTVAVNLATSLAKLGHKVGLLDSDVYGPNIPTMMGVGDQVPVARQDDERGELILPLEAHGVKIMSMGNLTKGDQPLVWRGPMLHGVVSQFLLKVDWGQLDYLVVDMPPGTGDVQLSLTQLVSLAGAVLVTTPQEVSLQDVRKALLMFEKVGVPILGIVENMSYFVCDSCDKRHAIFGTDGGKLLAEKFRTRLLTQLPLAAAVREAGDTGSPVVMRNPDSFQARAFMDLAKSVISEIQVAAARAGTESGAPVVNIGKF